MKKIEIEFDKNGVKKYIMYLVKYKKFFFIIFFGALFIFTFNVIYIDVYYNMKHVDYTKLESFEDSEAEKNIIFKKVIENMDLRQQAIQDIKNKEYKSPFDFNDKENLDKNDIEDINSDGNNGSNGDDNNGNNIPAVLPTKPSISSMH